MEDLKKFREMIETIGVPLEILKKQWNDVEIILEN